MKFSIRPLTASWTRKTPTRMMKGPPSMEIDCLSGLSIHMGGTNRRRSKKSLSSWINLTVPSPPPCSPHGDPFGLVTLLFQDGTREAAGGEHKSFANFLQQPIRGISGIDNIKKSILQNSHPNPLLLFLSRIRWLSQNNSSKRSHHLLPPQIDVIDSAALECCLYPPPPPLSCMREARETVANDRQTCRATDWICL